MSGTAITAIPSTPLKHRHSDDKCTENENYIPKKKRESAIRSENNLKMLIQNGQVDTNKQKVSPKKVLSLGKEARTETLATLISAGKFDKLEKLYIKTVAAASHGSVEDVETSDSEPETLPQPKTRLESETQIQSKPTNSTNNPINTTKVQYQKNTTNVSKTSPIIVLNPIITSNTLNRTVIVEVPNGNNISNASNLKSITKVPNSTNTCNVPNPSNTSNVSNPTSPTKVPNQTNTPNLTKNKNVPVTTNNDTSSLLDALNTPVSESVDSSIADISNNLDQNKEQETDSDLSRSSLDAEVLALHDLIRTLAPDNDDGTENSKTVDIKHIEDIYKTVLEVKSKLNTVYMQKSIKLKKSFETIQLFVPELKRGLTLPTLQQLKENLANGEDPKLLLSRQELPSHTDKPSPQQTKPAKSPPHI